MMDFDAATMAQIHAANPMKNTWVSANAGSGKTRVLTDRVARLLLHDTDPQRILCLTYTKAAAAEMQNRLFKRLGEWAMMSDTDLHGALCNLGEDPAFLTPQKLSQSRTLFAAALETPGGLKIQTIHSFCDALLRRFPLEAGVAPQFNVLEDRQATQLRSEIVEQMASGADTSAIDALAQYYTRMDTDDLTREIVQKRTGFTTIPTHAFFGIDEDTSPETLRANILTGLEDLLLDLLKRMESGSDAEALLAKDAQASLKSDRISDHIQTLEGLFLTKSGTPKKRQIPTQKVLPKGDAIRDSIAILTDRVEAARNQRLAVQSFHRSIALHQFATEFLKRYDERKAFSALLDYDDLIHRCAQLLTQSAMAQWVLYRLDGGLDHILVDEAQDTSPAQWTVIDCLAREFTYGASANDRPRSLFVVGDEKQSIYSFQGADPDVFGEKKTEFQTLLAHIDQTLADRALLHSFRSARPILQLVDTVFAGSAGAAMHNQSQHLAFHENKPGRIDIWPFIDPEPKPDPDVWYRPLDLPAPNDPRQALARRIADNLDALLQSEQPIEVEGIQRPVMAGDILILVQSRGPLFNAILKELKSKDLPVAGADRLNVGEELAVRDILSLLKFAAMADDDLSLAEAMRSPILGFTEGELFAVAHERSGTLWQALRETTTHESALEVLHDIRAQVDYLRPYELIERLLITHKARENLLARLGPEIEDGIDELLSQAMQYETLEAPTLTGFLHWFESGQVIIKRDMGMSANQIRLMTVHGAKGLEAPIVILPDTGPKKPQNRSQITKIAETAVWRSASTDAAETQSTADVAQKERDQAEKMRLLYVALTRAESWLIICGAGDRNKDGNCWYDLTSAAMASLDGLETVFPNIGAGHSVQNPQWQQMTSTQATPEGDPGTTQIPAWLSTIAPKRPRPAQPIAPSKLAGAKALPDDNALPEEQAKRRGHLLHLLLEYLPENPRESWQAYGQQLLNAEPDQTMVQTLISEAIGLLQNPNLHDIFFDPNSMAEVGITAPVVGMDQNMMGYIDRLIVTDSTITAVDFKSNAGIPDTIQQTPKGILAQQGAYLMALKQIYPDHDIDIAILWTRTGQIMSIPHNIAMNAFETSLHLDDSGERS